MQDNQGMKKETHDKQIGLRMDSGDIEALERIGVEIDRSVSWMIRTAVSEYIERYKAAKRTAAQAKQSS
jgi:predicted transcriptional regulator